VCRYPRKDRRDYGLDTPHRIYVFGTVARRMKRMNDAIQLCAMGMVASLVLKDKLGCLGE